MVAPRFVLDRMDGDLGREQLAEVYRLLEETGISYLSVEDRHKLLSYHDTVLEIQSDGRWQAAPAHTYDAFEVIP
jgi:ABC-type uncharacterized transport system fused permease/ATPase subunit